MKVPAWATRLAAEVCPEPPDLTWRRSRTSRTSSGRYMTSQKRVIVTAGTDRKDQRLVLLHELAHHLTPGEHHSAAFWAEAWRLYREHRLARYALIRETTYRAEAGRAARAVGIPGARAAAKTAAETRRRRTPPRGVCPMPEELAAAHRYRTPHTHYVGTIHRWTEADGTYQDFVTA